MQFLRILPILVLLPVLAFADGDKMFRVTTDQYKVGDLFEPFPEMAIKVSGSVTSTAPSLPLNENRLYLRHKKTPKEYHWVEGKVSFANYEKLHAFSLEKNHLTVFDVVQLRMYPTKNSKAFQDEKDIYFDREYIYSPRVPKLFFMKNGRWQVLKEDPLPGIIKVESPIKKLDIATINSKLRHLSKTISPVNPGPYAFVFSASGYMPYADIGVVQSGKTLTFKPNLVVVQSSSTAEVPVSVTVEQIAATPNLEYTEALYDKYVGELVNVINAIDTNDFAKIYPAKKQAASVGLDENDPVYKAYATRFDVVHAEAMDMWRKSQMAGTSVLDLAFKQKFDSLHALPARFYLVPDSISYDTEPDSAGVSEAILVFPVAPAVTEAPVDSLAPADSLASSASADSTAPAAPAALAPSNSSAPASIQPQAKANFLILKFSQPINRYDVTWKGQVPGYSSDALAAMLASPEGTARIIVSLQNNKPVWIYGVDGGISRHHYRYVKLEVQIGDQMVEAQGSFILPQYIFEQQEVQDWLNPPPLAPIESSSSSMPELSSSSSEIIPPSSSSHIETAKKIVNDPRRGQLAIIDSGSFRYYGTVVSMSPFAIQTTEMTQELMEKIMLHVDSAERVKDKSTFFHPQKPVHNINWYDARKVCQVHGGDLPTEAQWEFAGRAGSIEGAPWVLDADPDPSAYAIYIENSYKKRKGDDAYGPQQAATKKPNAWGIYDMSGNVAEWTRDSYFMLSFWIESSNPTGALFGYTKVYKGGSWRDKEKLLNMTVRDDEDPRYWSEALGFRCVYPLDVVGK